MRLRMRADLLSPYAAASDPLARPVHDADRAPLAALMLDAYRGTPDDAGEGPAEAAAEIARLFDGDFGAFDPAASEAAVRGGEIVNATLVTHFRGAPLIAFSMTSPPWKRRGLARAGMLRTLERLRRAGHPFATLAVTRENTHARALYDSLGFAEWPL